MVITAEELLEEYGQLALAEKKKFLTIVLRDSLEIETPELSDEELVLSAEDIFLELDRREEENAKS